MKRYNVSQQSIKEDALLSSGLLGISVIALIQFLGVPTIDTSLKISIYSFALSIPFLSIDIYLLTMKSSFKHTVEIFYSDVIAFAGPIATIVGITGIFWHFSKASATVFMLASIFAFISWWKFDDALKDANKDNDA